MANAGNLYESPKAALDDQPQFNTQIQDLLKGQKWIIYCILLQFPVGVCMVAVHQGFGILSMVISIAAIFGITRLARGLGYSTGLRVLLIILMLVPIPLISLIVLLSLNSKATKQLKNAGYRIGLLGAKT